MAYQDQNQGFQRSPMVDVSAMNIKCSDCGADIKELPFMPKRTEGLYCRQCLPNHRKPNRGF